MVADGSEQVLDAVDGPEAAVELVITAVLVAGLATATALLYARGKTQLRGCTDGRVGCSRKEMSRPPTRKSCKGFGGKERGWGIGTRPVKEKIGRLVL